MNRVPNQLHASMYSEGQEMSKIEEMVENSRNALEEHRNEAHITCEESCSMYSEGQEMSKIEEMVENSRNALEEHRNEAHITCEESCLCWELAVWVNYFLESEPEQGEFWNKGNKPKESGWYLVKYHSNDKPPVICYDKLWYNPDATPNWWYQTGCHSMAWTFTDNITHFHNFDEACDRIDRLEKQLSEQTELTNKAIKEIHRLEAENKELNKEREQRTK
jgi:hypothetical protein